MDAMQRLDLLLVTDIAGPDATHSERESILRAMRKLAAAGAGEPATNGVGWLVAAGAGGLVAGDAG